MRTNLLLPVIALLAACGTYDEQETADATDSAAMAPAMPASDTTSSPAESAEPTMAPGEPATAMLRDAAGRELGEITLIPEAEGIRIEGRPSGLPPGQHGFHLHTIGQCTPTFAAAGSHWNPTGRKHGLENPAGPHRGDLPNLEVAADSTGTVNAVTPGGRLNGAGGLLDADGAAVVIHAGPDDLRTDPSGASGDPIACGVVIPG